MDKMKFSDGVHFITVHPGGKNAKGVPVAIDNNGKIVGGMGGKFNGERIDQFKKISKAQKEDKPKKKASHDGVFTIGVAGMTFKFSSGSGDE